MNVLSDIFPTTMIMILQPRFVCEPWSMIHLIYAKITHKCYKRNANLVLQDCYGHVAHRTLHIEMQDLTGLYHVSERK